MAEIQWLNNLYVGRGINRATGEVFKPAITFEPERSTFEGEGQKPELTLKVIKKSSEFSDFLNVDASASLRVKTKGNVSVESSFLQKSQIKSYYLYALVTVRVTNAPKLIRNPVFTKDASDLLSSQGWEKFAKAYGLEYVEGYIAGGSYYALIEIQTTDSSKQRDIAGKLSGSFRGFGVDVKATVEAEQKINSALNDESIAVYVCQSGGKGDILETTLEEMIQQAKNFPELIDKNPVPISALTTTYEAGVTLPSIRPSDIFSLSPQEDKLDELGKRYLQLRDYRSSLEFALEHFDDLSDIDNADRERKRDELQSADDLTTQEMDQILKLANQCTTDPKNCSTITVPRQVQISKLPGRKLVNLKQMEEKLAELTKKVETKQFLSGDASKTFPPQFVNISGESPRIDTVRVDFPAGTFSTIPTVRVSLRLIDIDKNKSIRAEVYPVNITTSGFEVAFKAWSDAVVYRLDATWFAYT